MVSNLILSILLNQFLKQCFQVLQDFFKALKKEGFFNEDSWQEQIIEAIKKTITTDQSDSNTVSGTSLSEEQR